MAKKTDAGRKALEENRKRTQAAFAAAKQAEKDAAFRASEKARLDAEADAEVAAREAKRQRNTPQARAQRLAETKKAQEAKQGEARQLAAMVRAKRQKARGRKGRARPVTMQEAISQAAEIRQAAQDRAARTADAPSKTQVVDATYDAQGKIDTSGLADNTIVRTPEGTFKKYDTETGGLTDVAFDPISDKFGLPEQPKAGSFDTQDFTRTQLTELRKLGQSDPRFAEMFSDFQSRQIDIMRDPNLRPDERQAALDELSREIGDTYGMTAGYRRSILDAESAAAQAQAAEEQRIADVERADKVALIRREMREARRAETQRRRADDANADSQIYQGLRTEYQSVVNALSAQNEAGADTKPIPSFDEFRTQRLRQHSEDQMHIRQLRAFDDEQIQLENRIALLDEEFDDLNQFRNRLERQGVPMEEAFRIALVERQGIERQQMLLNAQIKTIDRKREDFLSGLVSIENRPQISARTAGRDLRGEFSMPTHARDLINLANPDGGKFLSLGRGSARDGFTQGFPLTEAITKLRKNIREGGDSTGSSDALFSAVREALYLYKADPVNLAGDRANAKRNFAEDYGPIIPIIDSALAKAGYTGKGPISTEVLDEAADTIRVDISKAIEIEKSSDTATAQDRSVAALRAIANLI
jgi:hypothetical protein